MADKIDINLRVKEYEDKIRGITSQIQELETKVAHQKTMLNLDKASLRIREEQEKSGEKITSSAYVDNRTTKELSQKILENQKKIDAQMATINKLKEQRVSLYDVQIENELKEIRKAKIAAQKSKEMAAIPSYKSSVKVKDVASLKKSLKEGHVVSLESFLNKEGGKHDYEATDKEIEKYLKEIKAVRISATQFAHLRETGYKDFESEQAALEEQLKTATGELKKEIEIKLKDLKTFQYNSKRKAPVGNEVHKILELTDKGLVDLKDAQKASEQIIQLMKTDAETYADLKTLVVKGSSANTSKNFAAAIKNAQDFQKMKISAGMVGGETETARSIALEKDGKVYLISGATDWTDAKAGKIGDYKTTSSFDPIHNLIQSVINATLIRAQEGEGLDITSKVAHLPLTNVRGRYSNTLPGVYDVNVGSYQEGIKLISDLLDVLEGKKNYSDVKIPGSVKGIVERGEQTYRGETREGWYYNGKPIGFWLGKTVEEVKSLLDSLNPQQKQQFLGTLYGETDGNPWYNDSEKNVKALREAFKTMYKPEQKQYKTYGGMSLSALSSKFESGELSSDEIVEALKSGIQTQTDIDEIAQRIFYGEGKYYSEAFVELIKNSFPDVTRKITDIFETELEKDRPGYLSGLNKEEKPQPSKYEMYTPDFADREKAEQQAWMEAGIERKKLGYTDESLFDNKGTKVLADRMTRLIDFYQRTTNIFNKLAEDINENLPSDAQPYTGEELARTYLARKSPEVYDRYLRSKSLYADFVQNGRGLSTDEQIKWINDRLDYTIAEEGDISDKFDTFMRVADQESKSVFTTEFARKLKHLEKPNKYVDAGVLRGLLTNATFGVAQEDQLEEFNKQRGRDVYGRTLSQEAVDELIETQTDNDISKVDFYKQKLSEMTEELGVSTDKIGIFSDYLVRVQKVADQVGIEFEQVLEGVDEKGFIKEGSLLDKQLKAIGETPVENLYLPTSGKRGVSGKARKKLFGLFDDTGIDSLPTQYDLYLNEQANKRDEELKKQEDIRLQKEQEFTKLIDVELENRLKFLYAQTEKPDYIKEQEKNERLAEEMGLSPEMFEEISKDKQETPGTTLDEIEIGADAVQKDNKEDFVKTIEEEVKVKEQGIEKEKQIQEAQEIKTQAVKEEVQAIQRETEQIKGQGGIQDVRKRGKMDDSYDKWIVDRVVKNELGEVTDTIYKKSRKSSGTRGPSGISQVVDKVIPAVENINKNIDEINNKIPGSLKNIDWESFQKWAEAKEQVEGKRVIDSSRVKNGGGDDGKSPKSGGRKGKSDEEKAQAATEKQQKQDIREYQQYINKIISLESQIDKLQRQATLSGGKHKDAIYGTIDALNEELGDLNRNNDALVKRVTAEQSATKTSIDATAELKKQSNAQKNLVSVKGATSIWDMMANDIRRATMRIADFGITAKILNKIPQDIQKVIQYTKELDAAMTNVRVVTGASAEEAQMLARGYTQLAKELGVTTVEIANSANEWNRQGYEAEEANNLIVASSKLAKLGMISTTEATKDLTSAIKGFKLSTEEAMSVVDKLTKIDQVAAISAGNLAEGLARVATTAQQAGLSLDETAAMVTTITEVTQRDASTAGEALRTLISRYSNVKAGVFTSMGEEAEETSENINDIEKVLGKLGIRIRTSGTEMRSIEDVLDELAEKWDTLDDVSRNAVASAFAGVRQRESFNILLSNWDRVKELTEESANAAGTADEKYTAYMESMEAATKRLQNAWEGFTQSLETSTIMKFLTNAVAFVVENMDKFKLVITWIAAANSLKIFDFFTNKGETGGLKGLIANIPFIGRGTKTNNILESIDKKVGNIEKGVGADSLANQTKNGGFFKRLGRFLKTGFGFGDIYDPKTGESISYNSLKTQKLFKINTPQQKEFEKLLKQRQIGNAAMGATSAVLTNLFTTKQVGGSGLGKLFNPTDQTVEETAGDKVGKTLASGALAAAGGYFLGPLGAMLGQVVGEGAASIVSTIVHRSELEMRQRVQEAKENLQALDSVKSTIESGNSIVSQELATSDDYAKLKEYTDNLSDVLYDYASDYGSEILDNIKNGLEEAGFDTSKIQTISDLCNQINEGNVEQRKLIQQQIDIELARKTLEETKKSYEADLADISESKFTFKKWDFSGSSDDADFEIINALNKEGFSAKNKEGPFLGPARTNVEVDLNGMDIYVAQEKIQDILEKNKDTLSDTAKEALEEYNQQLDKQIAKYEKIKKEIREQQVNVGLLESGVQDFTEREINEWGLEGLIMKVARKTENAVLNNGKIIDAYYDSIKSAIKADSHFNTLLKQNGETILDLTRQQDTFSKYSKGQIKLSEKDKAAVEGVGESWEAWYDLAMRGKLSDELAKVVLAANPERIKLFANAWNVTVEEAKKLADELPGLTTALGSMTPSEVLDYYTNLSDIFSDLSDNAKLTAKNFDEIISKYPKLMALYGKGNDDELRANILKTLGLEQRTAYKNAVKNAFLDNTRYVSLLEKGTDNDDSWITKQDADTQKEIYTALSQKTMRGLYQVLSGMDKDSEAYKAIKAQIQKVYGGEKEITIDDPAWSAAKEGIINKQDKIIKNLEEQKEALGKINDERKKEIELIKARDALENAKKEKVRVYRAGKLMPLSNYIG